VEEAAGMPGVLAGDCRAVVERTGVAAEEAVGHFFKGGKNDSQRPWTSENR